MFAGGLAAAGVLGCRRLGRFEVRGDSMRPTLEPGERLLIARTRRARPGDVAVVRDPRSGDRLVVKRVVAAGPGGLTLRGDNPAASTDSRHFGPVAPAALRGRAIYRYHPVARRGRIRPLVP